MREREEKRREEKRREEKRREEKRREEKSSGSLCLTLRHSHTHKLTASGCSRSLRSGGRWIWEPEVPKHVVMLCFWKRQLKNRKPPEFRGPQGPVTKSGTPSRQKSHQLSLSLQIAEGANTAELLTTSPQALGLVQNGHGNCQL